MAGPSPKGVLATKLKRMRLIAGNGILVLVPAVLFLAWKAGQGEFDAAFVVVQIVEFAAGSAQSRADGPEHPRRLAHDAAACGRHPALSV